MTYADIYYRAYRAFKEASLGGYTREREKIKDAVSNIANESDLCEYSCFDFRVENDWVDAIEAGLLHIEKAIEAQRRFIKYDGDIVRIEKARRTGVESVKHLSKHSNLIKEEREESILPEKIYVVENEENFAVYENRFIYMLLNMLNDFVAVRYNALTEAKKSAHYTFSVKRDITAAGRKIEFDIHFNEISQRLDRADEKSEQDAYIRIENVLAQIVSLLDTPLMKMVSKVPMLRPPIVRTNVLKMDPHFFAAHELYTFILSYTHDGYEITEKKERVEVLDDNVCEIICDSILFQANVAYMSSEKIRKDLEDEYFSYNAQRILLVQREKDERIAILKAKLSSGEIDAVSYIEELEETCEQMGNALSSLREDKSALQDKYKALRDEYDNTLGEYDTLKAQNSAILQKAEESEKRYSEQMKAVRQAHFEETARITGKFDSEIKKLENMLSEKESEKKALCSEFEKREKEMEITFDSRMHAYRIANGDGADEDLSTTREDFVRLEKEKKAFDEYYKRQWASARKNIRRALLWNKPNTSQGKEEQPKSDTDKEN